MSVGRALLEITVVRLAWGRCWTTHLSSAWIEALPHNPACGTIDDRPGFVRPRGRIPAHRVCLPVIHCTCTVHNDAGAIAQDEAVAESLELRDVDWGLRTKLHEVRLGVTGRDQAGVQQRAETRVSMVVRMRLVAS